MALVQGILAQPLWLLAWLGWLGLVNMGALLFLDRTEARIALGAFASAFVVMVVLAEVNGYNRLLGLGHVIFWTPMLVYLARRRSSLSAGETFTTWVNVLFVTNAISLVIDYVDVVRYLLGDRS